MAVFRYKGSKVWTMDFVFHAQRIRESTGTTQNTRAEDRSQTAARLEEGTAGIRKHQQPRLFSVASEAWLDLKKATLAPRSVMIEKANLAHLLPEFGRKLVCDIEPRDVAKYQQKRVDSGASPKTVNLEIGTLRAILKRSGQWARLQPDVKMLATREDVGRANNAGRGSGPATGLREVPFSFAGAVRDAGNRDGCAVRGDSDTAMGQRRFRESLLTLGQGQDGFRHGANHSPKPTCNGRPGLLGNAVPCAGA